MASLSANAQPRPIRQMRRSSAGSTISLPIFRRLRARGETAFRQHGRWISRHQIRTLLLCSLVITSLFYPAVGIYFWASKGGPGVAKGDAKSVWRSLSTPFMDSFASSGRRHVNSLSDLRMIWDDAHDLRALDARDAEAVFGMEVESALTKGAQGAYSRPRCQSLRVEHVFVTTDDVMSGHGHRFGVLDQPILSSALQLQNLISAEASKQPEEEDASCPRCVLARASFPGRPETTGETCLVLSPLDFWNHDANTIAEDKNPAATIAQSTRNQTFLGAPLSVPTTLAGRWHLFKRLPRAEYLAFTFFLHDPDNVACLASRPKSSVASAISSARDDVSQSHTAWLAMLQNLTGRHVKLVPSQQNISHELNLQFVPHRYSSGNTVSQLLLFSAYLLAIVYISRNLANLRKVHSRFGLAFTGTTQLLISMIMSVSICALFGIRLSFVPWELLPFVIVVVGSENMFILTKAIIDTPISLPVSSRIAHGLSQVGVSTTLTTLADIVLLSVIAFFISVKAVREFCIFAIFSLMMDWFLQMTLFVTVLSIDMQRLELADLLTQGTRQHRRSDSEDSTISAVDGGQKFSQSHIASGSSFVSVVRALWGARTARTASLTLILVYMGGLYLYYGTGYPHQLHESFVLAEDWNKPLSHQSVESASFDPFAHLDQSHAPLPWWTSSPSADLWNSLNPLGARELKITVEPWTILSLKTLTSAQSPPVTTSFAGWALFRPRIRAVIWFAKLVVLPIAGTTALLWMLLLYLLKDTELLDAQRDKTEAGPLDGDDSMLSLSDCPSTSRVFLVANAHKSDIELMAQDGNTIATIDTMGMLQLWRASGTKPSMEVIGSATKISDLSDSRRTSATTQAVTAMILNTADGWLALGFASGSVCFIKSDTSKLLWEASPVASAGPVSSLQLYRSAPAASAAVISCHRNGAMYAWHYVQKQVLACDVTNSHVTSRQSALWRFFNVGHMHASLQKASLIGCASSDAAFEIRRAQAADQDSSSTIVSDTIFRLSSEHSGHVRSALLYDPTEKPTPSHDGKYVLLGYADGSLRHFDLDAGELISTLYLDDGPVISVTSTAGEDEGSSVYAVQTTSKVSLVIVANSNVMVEASGSSGGKLGPSIRIRTPNGSRTHAATFWAGGSAPPSPSSELGNPLSYPMSSHGSASRLRRTSAYTRDRSSSSATISDNANVSGNSTSNGDLYQAGHSVSTPTIRIDGRQARLLGWIRCQRGGYSVGADGSCLIGVCRSRRVTRDVSGDDDLSSSRWEYWSLDLREELVMGRAMELMTARHPLLLTSSNFGSTQLKRDGLSSRPQIRFANGNVGTLAFTRLHPLLSLSQDEERTTSLLFGFGGSIGIVQQRSRPI